MKKFKVKIDDLNKINDLSFHGNVTSIDYRMKLIFLNTDKTLEEISKLPFVIRVTESRILKLQAIS